jgi:hypothetical protein
MLRSFHTFHMTSIGNKTIGAIEAELCHACMPRMGLASRSDGWDEIYDLFMIPLSQYNKS